MTKYLGKTTTIADGTGTLGQVQSIGPLAGKTDMKDVTTYGSGYDREYQAGLRDNGAITVGIFYDGTDASMNRLITRYKADPSLNTNTYTITYPDSKTLVFTGIIQGIGLPTEIDNEMVFTVDLKISGALGGTLGT